MYHLGHVVLWCAIPTVPIEYTIAAEIFPVNAQLHCSNYKWQQHMPATKQPQSSCLCEKYERKSYICSLHMAKID
jgi:hypothetical protein